MELKLTDSNYIHVQLNEIEFNKFKLILAKYKIDPNKILNKKCTSAGSSPYTSYVYELLFNGNFIIVKKSVYGPYTIKKRNPLLKKYGNDTIPNNLSCQYIDISLLDTWLELRVGIKSKLNELLK